MDGKRRGKKLMSHRVSNNNGIDYLGVIVI